MQTAQQYTIQEVLNRDIAIQQAIVWIYQDNNHSWTTIKNTGSMKPKFDENAIALLEKVDISNLKEGDLVVYEASWVNGTVMHEIATFNKDKTYFKANGVANKYYDPWAPCSKIKWKAKIVKWKK